MPFKAKHPCNRSGCRTLTDSRFCPEHAAAAYQDKLAHDRQRWHQEHRKVYKTAQWADTRRWMIMQAAAICSDCGAAGATEVHHRIPLRKWLEQGGNPYDTSNLLVLCHSCHSKRTRAGG